MPHDRLAQLRHWAGFGALIVILIINAAFLRFNAFRGFNFLDMGSFLDASWRVFRGQLPYVDFIYTTGPLHLYMNAFFFLLFGFGKAAILAHIVTVSSIMIVAVYLMARRSVPMPVSIVVSALTATSFYWPISHPWYDQSAHLWGLLALCLLSFHIPFMVRRRTFWICSLSGALAVLSFMTKSNIGAVYGAVIFCVLLVSDERVAALEGFALGAFLSLVLIIILIRDPARYFDQCFLSYARGPGQAGRLVYFTWGPAWLINYFWIPAMIVCVNLLFNLKAAKEFAVLTLGVYFIGLFSTLTGSILKYANVFTWGVQMAIAFVTLYKVRGESKLLWRRILHGASVLSLLGISVWWIGISARYGMGLKVWDYSSVKPFGNYALAAKSLAGWKCDRQTGEAVDALVKTFQESVAPEDSLLVLTDLQILYPLTGRESYRGIPYIFHQGVLPVPGKQVWEVRNRIMENPPDWIVINRGESSLVTYLIPYLNLKEYLMLNYTPVGLYGNYALLRKK